MQFDDVLRTWKGFFEREGVRYGVTGDLALTMIGWRYSRPRIEFVVDAAAGDRTIAFAETAGYRTMHASERCSVHRGDAQSFRTIAVVYAAALPLALSGLRMPLGDIALPMVDPSARFALSRADATALQNATMELDDKAWNEWFLAMCSALPFSHRIDGPWPEPFEL